MTAPTIAERLAALEERMRGVGFASYDLQFATMVGKWAKEIAEVLKQAEAVAGEMRGEVAIARTGMPVGAPGLVAQWAARLAPERP